MTRLTLVRHGETVWNADGRFQGHQDIPLNDAGLAQARVVAAALAAHPFTAVYTSDLARAYQTANLVAAPHGLTPLRDPRLREAHFGAWEGHAIMEISARWPELVAAWRQDSLRTRPPGGETLEQVQARAAAALADILRAHPDGEVAIVAHGGSLRALVVQALGADLSLFRRLRLDNCSISTIQVEDGGFTLMGLNDICHLSGDKPRASWDEAGDAGRTTLPPRG